MISTVSQSRMYFPWPRALELSWLWANFLSAEPSFVDRRRQEGRTGWTRPPWVIHHHVSSGERWAWPHSIGLELERDGREKIPFSNMFPTLAECSGEAAENISLPINSVWTELHTALKLNSLTDYVHIPLKDFTHQNLQNPPVQD